jgi:hypothetical protein
MLLHRDISIYVKFLHDFPNYIITAFVIGTDVKINVFIF